MIDAFVHDVRYALRQMRRAPGFSAVVVVTLALGIGANTALFSLLNAIVLRPVPVREPNRLAILSATDRRGQEIRFIYASTFREFAARQHVFASISLYSGGGAPVVDARGVSVSAIIEAATPEYFELLGVRPFLGRFISDADAPSDGEAAPVVVLGHRFWQRHYGGDPRAIGETLVVDRLPLTIIGVAPPAFPGLQVDAGSDFHVPMTVVRRVAGDPRQPIRGRNLIARLRPGITLEQARAEVETIWPSIVSATVPPTLSLVEADDLRSQRIKVESGAAGFSALRSRYAQPLSLMVGLSALLLVIACLNLSGLLLARAAAREQEAAIRLALGANRGRLVQQHLVESLLLAIAGTAVAMPLAWWTSRGAGALLWNSSTLSLAISMTPDGRVLALTSAVAIVTGVLIGTLPAIMISRRRTHVGLQPARMVSRPSSRSGRMLLVAQVALSLAMLVGAGLFARSLANLRSTESGFRMNDVLFVRAFAQPGGYERFDAPSYYPELLRQVSALPHVESAAFSHVFPAFFDFPIPTQPVGMTDAPIGSPDVDGILESVSPGLFETVALAKLEGRDFTWHDDARSPAVAIVNESLARRLFPRGHAIGQRIRIGTDPRRRAIEIVGVAGDMTVGNIRAPHQPVVFRPMLQEPQLTRVPIINVRATGDPAALGEALKKAVSSLGREYVRNLTAIEDQVDRSILQERLAATLSSFFGSVAVLLAFVGLYGLLAYAVARRTREIGVRMALGASRGVVLSLIVREGLVLTGLGVLIGVPLALAVGRLIRSLLYGLAPADPLTLVAAATCFIVIGSIAGLLPAYRASSVDPMAALRCD